MSNILMPVCRNWQTRQTQNLLSARVCGFKSRYRHQHMARNLFWGLRAFLFIQRLPFFFRLILGKKK